MKQMLALGALTRLYRVSYTIHAGDRSYMEVLGVNGSHDVRKRGEIGWQASRDADKHRAGLFELF